MTQEFDEEERLEYERMERENALIQRYNEMLGYFPTVGQFAFITTVIEELDAAWKAERDEFEQDSVYLQKIAEPTIALFQKRQTEDIKRIAELEELLAQERTRSDLWRKDSKRVREMRTPLDMPDGDGYFAFDGRIDGSSVERLKWCVMVRRNSIDKELYVYRFGGHTFKVSQMFGKWFKLQMPWDAPQEDGK